MAFEAVFQSPRPARRPRIAIVGGGISGLGAAWKLSETHDITLFEAAPRLGGHARTILAGPNRDIPVDTGFMVFNDRTYPNLIALFEALDIPSFRAPMSFAVSLDHGAFEYGMAAPSRILASKRNAVSPRFWRMIRDILHFNAHAPSVLTDPDMTLGELIARLGLAEDFADRYLYPLAGAIWSTARDDMRAFPAQAFVRFFVNHGLLQASGGPKWRTIDGGSRLYVERLTHLLERRGVTFRTGTPIEAIGRTPNPWVKANGEAALHFDQVILACHSDQAAALLTDPSPEERAILGAIGYRPNTAYLHADTSHMPKRRAAWASWVYKGTSEGSAPAGSFTYWMNSLQGIPHATPMFVTLNPEHEIPEHLIYDQEVFHHPQFDVAALKAQSRLHEIQGQNGTWFCGAWTRYGFHEDGLLSAVNVAAALLESERQAVPA